MNYKLRSFVACLLCFFQCVMLFSSDILAATGEGGGISAVHSALIRRSLSLR